jgi:hypothetical protein
MRHTYPVCTACEYKAEFDIGDRVLERAWRYYFSPTPLLTKLRRKHGKTIRIPLVYG